MPKEITRGDQTTDGQRDDGVRSPRLPSWISEPMWDFTQQNREMERTIFLAKTGISVLPNFGAIAEFLEGSPYNRQFGGEDAEAKLAHTKELAAHAEREIESGFPMMNAQSVVALWSLIETFVRSFLVGWMENEPGALQVDAIKKLSITIGEYEALSPEEKCPYILDRLELDRRSRRPGVSRFEAMLEIFGLNGPVDAELRKTLLHLWAVRNLIVHKRGKADKIFVEQCPWLGMNVGDEVHISDADLAKFTIACGEYVMSMIPRLQDHFGVPRTNGQTTLSEPEQARPP